MLLGRDDDDRPGLQGLPQACAPDHGGPCARLEQGRRRLGRRHQLAGSSTSMPAGRNMVDVLGESGTRVVGDKGDGLAGVVQAPDRFGRTGDGRTRQPHDAVEIEDPEHPGSLLRTAGRDNNGGVPSFQPFPGLRYSRSHVGSLDDVVCPPYDVISEPERAALVARSPSNIVRLELPRDDERPGDRYQRAAALLDAWRDGGILHRDPVPAFYGYRMRFTDPAGATRQTVGVIGALELEPPGSGILPHEQTTPKAKTDRLELLRATRANLSPIWGLTPAAGLAACCPPPGHPAEHAVDTTG